METNLPDAYVLLLARLIAVERELEAVREELAELRMDAQETWLGGTD